MILHGHGITVPFTVILEPAGAVGAFVCVTVSTGVLEAVGVKEGRFCTVAETVGVLRNVAVGLTGVLVEIVMVILEAGVTVERFGNSATLKLLIVSFAPAPPPSIPALTRVTTHSLSNNSDVRQRRFVPLATVTPSITTPHGEACPMSP